MSQFGYLVQPIATVLKYETWTYTATAAVSQVLLSYLLSEARVRGLIKFQSYAQANNLWAEVQHVNGHF